MLIGKVSLMSNLVVLFQFFKTKNYKTNILISTSCYLIKLRIQINIRKYDKKHSRCFFVNYSKYFGFF